MEMSFKTTNNIWKSKLEKSPFSGDRLENEEFSEHRERLDHTYKSLRACRLELTTTSSRSLLIRRTQCARKTQPQTSAQCELQSRFFGLQVHLKCLLPILLYWLSWLCFLTSLNEWLVCQYTVWRQSISCCLSERRNLMWWIWLRF